MKIVAYTALLYGADYLGWAIRSVIDYVDEYWCLYSPTGSHGHQTDLVCPDHAADLYDIAKAAAGEKLHFYTASPGQWIHENQQREYIHTVAPDADVILVLDADEVWSINLVRNLIEDYIDMGNNWNISRLRLPIIHYWRSFLRCVVHDPAFPERIIFPKVKDGHTSTATVPSERPIHHFGYAQRSEIVQYKIETHGHKAEWRKDVDWFNDRFMANAQVDCHPVGSEYWNPETVDPYALGLPAWMKAHKYAEVEVIP
jgi:hypothetical protein